ncbi:BTAD domain-containing putative transcriptional regulator [Microbacterium sp. NPDC019599]|uniref:nSTAND1 domain-containing NTPase n=1 Tax=Microbacterium sp. NPDC019599 TaxID=3154690 RepID=UPI0034041E4F
MVVKVLGPLDTGTDPLSPRERTVLSALIVRAGSTIAPSELAEAWWGDAPPRTWEQQIRNSVARIRARLGRGSIETLGWEYRLSLDADSIDAFRFERLVSTARGHVLRGEHERAVDAYGRALALWRGAPLQDVTRWEPGVVEAMRLGEIRASAEEELLDARLAVGEHRSVIADAERLLREQPLREDRWTIVALANYRADRQAEALAVLRAARERLADELGIEPGPRLASLELAMLRRDPALDVPAASARTMTACPYPGLRPFGPDDADVFFGREDDVEALLERVAPRGIVTIAGASGTGKSSLVLAGLVPRLRARGSVVEIVRPSVGGVSTLGRAAERGQIIVVDQAEELLAIDHDEVRAFARTARAFLDDGHALLMTVRSDALDRLRAFPEIGDEIGRGIFLLGGLSDAAYRSAIEQPARQAGLVLEPGLVEVAVRDAGDRASTLPHLSHAMQETWARREGTTLTVDGYQRSGGIPGAIAQSAEEAFRELAPDEQASCRNLMLRLIERGADGVSTRRRVVAEPLLSDAGRRRVLERMVRARLVTLDGDAVVVAHEAVATAWPRLDAWLEEDAEGARTLRSIESGAAVWAAGGKDDDDLLRGARLHSALTWQDSADPDLTPVERDFLTASDAREQGELRDLNERAGRDRRRNRVLGAALAGAGILLVAAIVAGSFAAIRGQEATAAAEDAQIEALVATSLSLRSSDRELAALLAVEAHRRWPDDDRARSALFGVMTAADGLISRTQPSDTWRTLTLLGDGSTALQAIDDPNGSRLEVVDTDTGAVVRTLDAPLPERVPPHDRTVATSPNGRYAVIQSPRWAPGDECCLNHVLVVDLESGQEVGATQLLAARTSSSMAFRSDSGAVFLSNPVTFDLQSIELTTGEARASSPNAFADHAGEDGFINGVANIGGGLVAVGTPREVVLYDETTLEVRRRVPTEGDLSAFVVIGDGAGGLIASGSEGITRLDGVTGHVLWTAPTVAGRPCWGLALDAASDTLYCSRLGAVSAIDADTGRSLGRELATLVDDALNLHLRSEARELLLSSRAGELQRWALDGGGPASALVARGRQLVDGLGADGSVAITSAMGGGPRMAWNLDTDAPVGDEAEWLGWVSGDVMERWTEADGSTLLALDGSEARLSDEITDRLGESFALVPASPGTRSYAVGRSPAVLVAFEPRTGSPSGPFIEVPDVERMQLISVSESDDGAHVAFTYFDDDTRTTQTAVFDASTGALVTRGLQATEGNRIVGSDELITVTDTALTRHDLLTLEAIESFPKPFSSGNVIEVSDDGRTMLVVGWDNRAALYGLVGGVKLGDTLDAPSPELAQGAHLSRDGKRVVASSPEGLLVWDLDPAHHALAACAIAGRELTPVEWRTYFGDEPQRPTCQAQSR